MIRSSARMFAIMVVLCPAMASAQGTQTPPQTPPPVNLTLEQALQVWTISATRSLVPHHSDFIGERRTSVTVPTLVVGGDKSPAPVKDAVATVAGALPNARRMYLNGQDHNLSAPAVAPVNRQCLCG